MGEQRCPACLGPFADAGATVVPILFLLTAPAMAEERLAEIRMDPAAQGYFLGKPMTAARLVKWLRERAEDRESMAALMDRVHWERYFGPPTPARG